MTAERPSDIAPAPWLTVALVLVCLALCGGIAALLTSPAPRFVRVGALADGCPVFGWLDRDRRVSLVALCPVTWSEVTRP